MLLNAGLPLRLEHNELVFAGIPVIKPDFRRAKDMKGIAHVTLPDDEILYLMYRGVRRPEHAALFGQANLRYDITVLLPKLLGSEYAKTAGHYHSKSKKMSFPEIYEVIYGRAHFLVQKGTGKITDAVLVEAHQGDVIIVPPDYGHITINPSREVLVLANLISLSVKSDYKAIKKCRGGAYFETTKGIVPNAHARAPPLRTFSANQLGTLGITSPLYTSFAKQPERFAFLNGPEKFLMQLAAVLPKR